MYDRLLSEGKPDGAFSHLTTRQAAVLIDDALHGRNSNHKMDDTALWVNDILRSRWYSAGLAIFILIDLLLAVVERPSSLHQEPKALLPVGVTGSIEALCLLVFAVDVALRYRYFTTKQFWKTRWTLAKLAFVCLAVVNTALYLIFGDGIPRLHRFARPIMVAAQFRNVAKIFGNMLVSIPRVANVAVLLIFHVVFFGVLAHVMFGGIDCTLDGFDRWSCDCRVRSGPGPFCSPFSKNCYDYFGNIGCSMDQLFILLTTANYPDVMLPAYHCFQWAPIFFVAYLVIGLFFMLNLVLAVSYSVFQGHTRDKVLNTVNKRVTTLDRIFDGILASQHFATDEAVQASGLNVSGSSGLIRSAQRRLKRRQGTKKHAKQPPASGPSFDASAAASRGPLSAQLYGRNSYADKRSSGDTPSVVFASSRGGDGAASGAELARMGDTDWQAGQEAQARESDSPVDEAELLEGQPGEIGWQMWRRLMVLLRPDFTEAQVAVLFRTMDTRGVGSISKEDFRQIATYIEVRFRDKLEGKQTEYWCYRCSPRWLLEWRQSVRIVVSHWVFRSLFDLLIYVNAFLIVIDFSFEPGSGEDKVVTVVMQVLLGAFAVELAIKLFGLGVRAFMQDWFNVLDIVVVPSAIIVGLILLALNSQTRIVEKIAFFRILRMLRALRALPNFGLLIRTFTSIVPMFARYMIVAVLVYYMFAILGMELFAGLIQTPGPSQLPTPLLNGTAYLESSYWDVTFDSLGRSYVTLFALMVVNNWAVTMEGYVAVTNRWFMTYFYVWYFVIVILVLNIITAFLLDDFTVMQAQIEDELNGLMPAWQLRITRAAKELRVEARQSWLITRPKHPQQVYELMFADDIAKHLDSLDTIDDGISGDKASRSVTSSDGLRHRTPAGADGDSLAPAAEVAGPTRRAFDPASAMDRSVPVPVASASASASATSPPPPPRPPYIPPPPQPPASASAASLSGGYTHASSSSAAQPSGQAARAPAVRALQHMIHSEGLGDDATWESGEGSPVPALPSGDQLEGSVQALRKTKRASTHHRPSKSRPNPSSDDL